LNAITQKEIVMRRIRLFSLLAVALPLCVAAVSAPANAQGRRDGYGPAAAPGSPGSFVTAESRWGNGRVSGPVRPGKFGPEVRLPGGTWVHCVRSCSETLRRETVDFWQSHGREAPDQGPGYFQWDFRF
jgi:hypothetical protein